MHRRLTLAFVALLACFTGAMGFAHAQQPGRVLLGGDPNVSPLIQRRLAEVFSRFGPVLPTETPPESGDLAVVAELARGPSGATLLRLTYYDGLSGAVLLSHNVPLRGGKPTSGFATYIIGRAQTARSMLTQPSAAPPPQAMGSPTEMRPLTQQPTSEAAGSPTEMQPPTQQPAPEAAPPEGSERDVTGSLALGVGPGMHEAELPTDVGNHQLPLSTFPALDLLLQVDGTTHEGRVTPGVRFSYRTSVGYTIEESPPNGQKARSAARTHELLLDVTANINFGDSRTDVSLPLCLGFALNNSRTDVELLWPRYTLAGPHARAMLRIPFAKGDVVLTLGPDVEWIAHISSSLEAAGLKPSGFAFGGELQLAVRLSERFALRALYREARASIKSARVSQPFSDTQRFITTGIAATF